MGGKLLDKLILTIIFYIVSIAFMAHLSSSYNLDSMNFLDLHGKAFAYRYSTRLLQNDISSPEPISVPLTYISGAFGVVYFCSWGSSYVPQIFMNWKRKRVDGMSLDYAYQNEFGFLCYQIYCIWQYVLQSFHGAAKAVETSDLAFATLSFISGGIVFIQCFIYPRGEQKPSIILKLWLAGLFAFVILAMFLAIFGVIEWATTIAAVESNLDADSLSPLDQFLLSFTFIQSLGYVKSAIVAVKYIPQITLNYKRKTTVGLAIAFYYLDLIGAIASTIEMGINTYNFQTSEFFFGNIPKLIILVVTYVYDIIVLYQHHVLYAKNNKKIKANLITNNPKRPTNKSTQVV